MSGAWEAPRSTDRPSRFRIGLGGVVLAVLTTAAWWSWLGRDERTARLNMIYDTSQVIGVVVTLLVIGFLAGVVLPWVVVVAVMTVVLTVAWSWYPSQLDSTGLWGIGAVMVLCSSAGGSVLAALAGGAVRRRISPDRP